QLFPRVGADEAVDLEVTLPLEPADRGLRRGAERAVALRVRHDGTERRQPRLDVRDLRTSITHAIDVHRSESAWARSATATAAAAMWGRSPTTGAGRGPSGSHPWAARRSPSRPRHLP